MNKKTYIKPELMVEVLETVEVIATSIPIVDGEGEDQLSNSYRPNRRGKWGDLWYVED
jgi:hypothetical protein